MEEAKEIKDRGLLDLSVELSTRDIMAGNDFTLYVLINNPFTKPVWIRRVHVNLPSELGLARPKADKQDEATKKSSESANEAEKSQFDEKIALISKEISKLDNLIEKNKTTEYVEDIRALKNQLEDKLFNLIDNIDCYSNGNVNIHLQEKAGIGNLKIAAKRVNCHLQSDAGIGNIEILDPKMAIEMYAHARQVELESSLPENTALQPGNTVVYSVILNVNKPLLFRPSKYRLQFNANYSFNPKLKEKVNEESSEAELFTNTIAYELSIRASIHSVLKGSVIGGFVGGIARILQLHPSSFSDIATWSNFMTMSASIILAIMSIIFMARKSDAQSFVSIEDFWGGILVGFLVGYTGTSFFEDLTKIPKPTLPTK